MKLYQSINNYLLRNHPNIWITRIHLFAPIAIVVFVLLFGLNALMGYNLHDKMPRIEDSIPLMIIPILVYLVYWFVFQARYNVEKSGGKLNLFQDYLNYFSYFLIFFLSFMLLMVIPMSTAYKISNSVSKDQLQKDIKILNTGYGIFNENYNIEKNEDIITFRSPNKFGYSNHGIVKDIKLSTKAFEKMTTNYINTFNKYDKKGITLNTSELIRHAFSNDVLPDSQSWRNSVRYKVDRIQELQKKGCCHEFTDDSVFMILGVFLAMFALLVWIFKQIHWKHYVFGLVSILLTPMLIGIVGLIFFEVFDFDESGVFLLVYALYIGFAIKVIAAVLSPQSNKSAIVMAMYLQLALPFLPVIIFGDYMSKRSYFDGFEDHFVTVYIVSWIVGLISIAVFKYIYKRLTVLPSKK